jgi:hypothetical protein
MEKGSGEGVCRGSTSGARRFIWRIGGGGEDERRESFDDADSWRARWTEKGGLREKELEGYARYQWLIGQ